MPSLKFEMDGRTPHIHIYARPYGSKKKVYYCDHPQCNHSLRREQLIGKLSRCAVCRTNTFLLTREDLELAQPRCEQCSNRKKAIQKREIRRVLEELELPNTSTSPFENQN